MVEERGSRRRDCEGQVVRGARDLFGKCGSGKRVSAWQSIAGEIPLRIPAARDAWCMDPRAEADWCACRGGVDGVIAKDRWSEEQGICLESVEVASAYPGGAQRQAVRRRAARRLDQLGVRGDPFLRHPWAAVDAVPGRQPRHGGAPTVLEQVLDDTATVSTEYLPICWRWPRSRFCVEQCGGRAHIERSEPLLS